MECVWNNKCYINNNCNINNQSKILTKIKTWIYGIGRTKFYFLPHALFPTTIGYEQIVKVKDTYI